MGLPKRSLEDSGLPLHSDRSHDRPTPSRGASRKICSLELLQILSLVPDHSCHSPVWVNAGHQQPFTYQCLQTRVFQRRNVLRPPIAKTATAAARGRAPPPPDKHRAGGDSCGGSDASSAGTAPFRWEGGGSSCRQIAVGVQALFHFK